MKVERLQPADAEYVIEHIREADRLEIYRLAALQPRPAIEMTVQRAVASWTIWRHNRPIGIFGMSRRSYVDDVGRPWLLGTDDLVKAGPLLARDSMAWADHFARVFPQMENWVDAENTLAVQWLSWLGFDMDEPRSVGLFGYPFVRFSLGMRDVP